MQKQLRNYEFPPRVWLLKESNRSPLDTQLFALFLLLRFILTEREKKKQSPPPPPVSPPPKPRAPLIGEFQTTACKWRKKKKKSYLAIPLVVFCLFLSSSSHFGVIYLLATGTGYVSIWIWLLYSNELVVRLCEH